MPAKPETLDKIHSFVSQGFKAPATWTWAKVGEEILASEGVDVGDRKKEVCEHFDQLARGFYPNREKSWDATFVNVTEDLRKIEYQHIAELALFTAKFTLEKRPVPPQKEKKTKAPKEGAPIPPPPAAGDTPPAPPAPPAVPAPPAPPPPSA